MAAYEQLAGRLSAVDADCYVQDDAGDAPAPGRELAHQQLCAYAQGNAFVHDLPPTAQSGVCPEAEPELRRVRAPPLAPPRASSFFAPSRRSSFISQLSLATPSRSDRASGGVIGAQKWGALTREELTKACQISLEDLRRHCAEIPCMGCRSAIEALLTQLAARPSNADIGPFAVLANRVVKLRGELLADSDKACSALLRCRNADLDAWITKSKAQHKGNKRCPLHSLKPRPVGAWIDVWLLMSDDCHRVMLTALTAERFEDALQAYLRKHKFCSHCRSVVLEAYDMLILDRHATRGELSDEDSADEAHGHSDDDALADTDDIAHAERLFKKLSYVNGRIVIPNDATYVQELLDRAERSMRGEQQSQHVKQGSLGQDEVLSCLGGCLWEELQNLWRQMVNNERSWCMLQHVASMATLTHIDVSVDEKVGDRIMLELLAEEEGEKNAASNQKSKKAKKKARQKAKKAAAAAKKAEEERSASAQAEETASKPGGSASGSQAAAPSPSPSERQKDDADNAARRSESSEGSEGESHTPEELPTHPPQPAGGKAGRKRAEVLGGVGPGGLGDVAAGVGEPEPEEEGEGESLLSAEEIAAFQNKYKRTKAGGASGTALREKLRQKWCAPPPATHYLQCRALLFDRKSPSPR